MDTLALRGRVVTEHEIWDEGTLVLEGSTIKAVSRDVADADKTLEYPDSFLVPGFVDLQINGAFGIDVVSRPERLKELSARLVGTGTTAYLPTVISQPPEAYPNLLPRILPIADNEGAEPLGLHLEGPFLNPEKRGAHPEEHIAPMDVGALVTMLDVAPVRMLTVAPELHGADKAIRTAVSRGVVVSIGHSEATFAEAYKAMSSGGTAVTHLFNAMSPLHHREPGLPGAAFAHSRVVCGIIADGRHVHPEVVDLAFRLLGPDRIYLITDAIAAAGMETGEYTLAGQHVFLDDGVPRLGSGALAGSILVMNEALRNVMEFTGCTIVEAVRMASLTPTRLIGEVERRGRLAPGYQADIVALSQDLEVESVWIEGERKLG
jgi:N-acetylglucosamine-6-phosphate deacetylase